MNPTFVFGFCANCLEEFFSNFGAKWTIQAKGNIHKEQKTFALLSHIRTRICIIINVLSCLD